jgi:hypothetical protein
VTNSEGNIVQTALFDGSQITFTCQGESDTSTITQTPDSITVNCKTFLVEAETITTKSTKETNQSAGKAYTMKSDQDFSISGKNVNVTADSDITGKGTNVTLTGSSKVSLSGTKVECKGSASGLLSGAKVDVKATGSVTVQGLSAKISAPSIKLG